MKLRTWDIETVEWNKFQIGGIFDGEKSYLCNSPKELIENMRKIGGTFYAHYGGGFDHLFLLENLKKYKIKIVNIGKNFTKISVYYKNSKKKLFELRDSWSMFPDSLNNLAKNFLHKKKKDIDRKNIQGYSKKEIDDYVLDDCYLLYDIISKFMKNTEQDNLSLTIASASKKEHSKMFDQKTMCVPAVLDKFLRKAYSGGRVEVFKRYGKNLNHYDVKSMYPWAMKNKTYPCGYAIYTEEFVDDLHGIYDCDIITPEYLHIPFLHTYDKDGRIIFPLGEFSGTYTSPEILKAISIGYKINIKKGYFFEFKSSPFTEYVDKWYGVKQEAERTGDLSMRYIAKLYLNSLYGKFGQRRTFQKIMAKDENFEYYLEKYGVIKDYIEELNLIIVDENSTSKYTSVHIAAFVTAYARIRLYEGMEEIISKGGEIYYTDTDCLVTDGILACGKELGDWDLENESEIKEGVFLFPKFYSYITEDDLVQKHKGLSQFYEFEEYKKALKTNNFDIFSETWTSIASVLECKQRHLPHLSVIEKSRSVKGGFTKRNLIENYMTTPLSILETIC